MIRWLARKVAARLVWVVLYPLALLAAFLGVCWAIDWLDRMGALNG